MNGEYAPLCVFDDDVLVLPSGRSLIAQLLTSVYGKDGWIKINCRLLKFLVL
jgi:hypothetical protein